MSKNPDAGFWFDAESTIDTLSKPIEFLERLILKIKNIVEKLTYNTPKK